MPSVGFWPSAEGYDLRSTAAVSINFAGSRQTSSSTSRSRRIRSKALESVKVPRYIVRPRKLGQLNELSFEDDA